MRGIDFTSWQGILSTLIGLALITVIGVGIRLLAMYTIQQRRERDNRQINERLRALIAAYKTLGGSFTGDLTVDPTHRRDLRRLSDAGDEDALAEAADAVPVAGSDRSRRMRDAVEAALSDIILLGTDEHVRLAERAARELVAGRPVYTGELVISLRTFIRKALGLDPVPAELQIPTQGPTRPSGSGGRGGGGGRDDAGRGGRSGGGGGAAMGGGAGLGAGLGMGAAARDDETDRSSP